MDENHSSPFLEPACPVGRVLERTGGRQCRRWRAAFESLRQRRRLTVYLDVFSTRYRGYSQGARVVVALDERYIMFNLDPGILGEIILRTVSVYVALLLGLRIAGKRELGQMTAFDLVVILIISNAVQNAMVGPDVSLTGGITAALTLLVVNRIVNLLAQRVPWLKQEITGSPSLLVHEGTLVRRISGEKE